MSGSAPSRAGIYVPFAIITLIWGSTWLVIKGQLGTVPPAWSVTYRFAIAAGAMFVYSAARHLPLRIGHEGHWLALAFGIPQFCLNYNGVYFAERHVTSGLVAVVFALLLVPNTALGWLFLRTRITAAFLIGSTVAVGGVALLFLHEARAIGGGYDVLIGIGYTLAAVLSASVANVMQAAARMRTRPVPVMVAWGMTYGVLANALFALVTSGPPALDARAEYWLGLAYLGLVASALAFTLYYVVIRAIGPARAAYSSVIIPVIAMALSTLFEGYRWSLLAGAGGVLTLCGLLIALRSRAAPAEWRSRGGRQAGEVPPSIACRG